MISWLRLTPLGDVVPLDDNINFHKIIATAISIAGLIHMYERGQRKSKTERDLPENILIIC